MTTRIAALVAAAGMSSRMHEFKPLLPFAESSVIDCIIGKFTALGAEPVVVVTGHNHDLLAPVAEKAGAEAVLNPRYADTGMFESLVIGLERLAGRCDAVFVQPCDIPLVTTGTLHALLRVFRDGECAAVRPVHQGWGGHPLLLSAGAIPFLLTYDGDGGLRQALRLLPGRVVNVPVDDEGTILDANRPEEYRALLDKGHIS